jgi:hypothetical protein
VPIAEAETTLAAMISSGGVVSSIEGEFVRPVAS